MKNYSFFSLILSCILFFSIVSCGGDDNAPGPVQQECLPWDEEYTDLINTATAYANDDSPANCNAYKAAYVSYLNAYRDYGTCFGFTGADLQEFQEAISEAEADIAAFDCN